MPISNKRSEVQALYLKEIYAVAKKLYDDPSALFPIDPQGRVLVAVQLDQTAWERIYRSACPEQPAEVLVTSEQIKHFKEKLGHPITETTVVSLDLQDQNSSQLLEKLDPLLPEKNKEAILKAYQGLAKGRIISLQQETYFHAHLIGRMVKAAVDKEHYEAYADNAQIQQGIDNALIILNEQVLKFQAKALQKAYNTAFVAEHLNEEQFASTLNKELDAARKQLLPAITKIIRIELIKETGITFSEKITRHLTKHLAEATSASAHDVVHIDKGLGLVSFIGASEHTSHHQQTGADQIADRIVYSHHLQEEGNVVALSNRQQIRVPSLAVKQADPIFARTDAAQKIAYLQTKYKLGEDGGSPKAFIYNLYTTLNQGISGWWDERRNQQSQSAEQILNAAHLYNRHNPDKPWCLVQNIAVNGWGHELSIHEKNPWLVNEAALMTQMASLHTLYEELFPPADAKAKTLFDAYAAFLKAPVQPSFYAYLHEAKPELLTLLENLKQTMVIPAGLESVAYKTLTVHKNVFTSNAKWALMHLFKENAFSHKENGFTYQALAVFVEQASLGGCKSANERAQAVNGRVAMLDFISLNQPTRDRLLDNYLSKENAKKLKSLANNLETNIKEQNTAALTRNLDALYEALNLEGFQALISFLDQGGHAKLGTKSFIPDTNNCETVKTHVTNAAQWQCHKGLTDQVLKEFRGIEKLRLEKEISRAVKTIGFAACGGAGVGTAAFLIASTISSVAFPPLGIAIGLGAATMGGLAVLGSLGHFLYKLSTIGKSATQKRFAEIQKENGDLIKGSKATGPKASIALTLLKSTENKENSSPAIEPLSRAKTSSSSQLDLEPKASDLPEHRFGFP